MTTRCALKACGLDKQPAGGGGYAQAGIYTLEAAIGQPFADLDSASGRELCAGFECAPQGGSRIYLPLIKK